MNDSAKAPEPPSAPGDAVREAAVAHARTLGVAAVEHAREVMDAVRERLAPAAVPVDASAPANEPQTPPVVGTETASE